MTSVVSEKGDICLRSIVSAVLTVMLFVFAPANDEPAVLPKKIQVVTVRVAKEEE